MAIDCGNQLGMCALFNHNTATIDLCVLIMITPTSFTTSQCHVLSQNAVIEGTYLAMEYMSTRNGGKGGTVINVASMGGQSILSCDHSCGQTSSTSKVPLIPKPIHVNVCDRLLEIL